MHMRQFLYVEIYLSFSLALRNESRMWREGRFDFDGHIMHRGLNKIKHLTWRNSWKVKQNRRFLRVLQFSLPPKVSSIFIDLPKFQSCENFFIKNGTQERNNIALSIFHTSGFTYCLSLFFKLWEWLFYLMYCLIARKKSLKWLLNYRLKRHIGLSANLHARIIPNTYKICRNMHTTLCVCHLFGGMIKVVNAFCALIQLLPKRQSCLKSISFLRFMETGSVP